MLLLPVIVHGKEVSADPCTYKKPMRSALSNVRDWVGVSLAYEYSVFDVESELQGDVPVLQDFPVLQYSHSHDFFSLSLSIPFLTVRRGWNLTEHSLGGSRASFSLWEVDLYALDRIPALSMYNPQRDAERDCSYNKAIEKWEAEGGRGRRPAKTGGAPAWIFPFMSSSFRSMEMSTDNHYKSLTELYFLLFIGYQQQSDRVSAGNDTYSMESTKIGFFFSQGFLNMSSLMRYIYHRYGSDVFSEQKGSGEGEAQYINLLLHHIVAFDNGMVLLSIIPGFDLYYASNEIRNGSSRQDGSGGAAAFVPGLVLNAVWVTDWVNAVFTSVVYYRLGKEWLSGVPDGMQEEVEFTNSISGLAGSASLSIQF